MHLLIELRFKNEEIVRENFVQDGSDSLLLLCDGKENITIGDETYIANLLTSENDFLVNYTIDNSKTYNLQSPTDFNIKFLDDGLFRFIKTNNININNIQVTFSKFVTSKEIVFTGVITNLELLFDTISLTSTCVLDKLGLVGETIFYGQLYKEKLEKTELVSQKIIKFTCSNNISREFPEIVGYGDINVTLSTSSSYSNGIVLYDLHNVTDKRTFLIIKHFNDVNIPNNSVVKFISSNDSDNKDAVRYVKESIKTSIGNYYETKLFLDVFAIYEPLPSQNVSIIDVINIENQQSFYEIPNNPNTENLKVNFKNDNGTFSEITQYTISAINEKTYIVIEPFTDVWYKLKIDDIVHSAPGGGIFHYPTNNHTSALLSDTMSDFYAWKDITIGNSKEEVFEIISSELKEKNFEELYFGIKLDIPNFKYDIDLHFNLILNNNKYWPCIDNGNGRLYTDDYKIYSTNGGTLDPLNYVKHTIPLVSSYGDPGAVKDFLHSISATTQTKQLYQAWLDPNVYLQTFNSSAVFKFPDNVIKNFSTNSKLLLTLNFVKRVGQYSYDNHPYIINKMQLLTKETLQTSDLKEIYIDYYNPTIPEDFAGIKNDLLIRAGLSVQADSSFITTKMIVKSTDNINDILVKLSSLGINIVTYPNGTYVSYAIGPVTETIDVIDVLTYETNIQQLIKYPTLKFKNTIGEDCHIKLFNFDGTYPINSTNLSSIKTFWEFKGFDYLFDGTLDSVGLLMSINSYILKPIFDVCKKSISNQTTDISIDNIYSDLLTSFPSDLYIIKKQCLLNITQKEYITVKTTSSQVIGRDVVFTDPRFFNNSMVTGILQDITIDTLNQINQMKILITNIKYATEDISIYDQGSGTYDKYIDNGFSSKLILQDK